MKHAKLRRTVYFKLKPIFRLLLCSHAHLDPLTVAVGRIDFLLNCFTGVVINRAVRYNVLTRTGTQSKNA
jgi:hypothetical protein